MPKKQARAAIASVTRMVDVSARREDVFGVYVRIDDATGTPADSDFSLAVFRS
jgi:hypothetical protein